MKKVLVSMFAISLIVLGGFTFAKRGGNPGSTDGGSMSGPWPMEMILNYCRAMSTTDPACPDQLLTFNDDNSVEAIVAGGPTYTGTWEYTKGKGKKNPNTLVFNFDDGTNQTTYEGVETSENCFEGTMSSTTGLEGAWDGCL